MRLISWNIQQRGGKRFEKQVAALDERAPDIVCLQEIFATSAPRYAQGLARLGLENTVDTFSQKEDRKNLVDARKYGLLIASRWPVTALEPESENLQAIDPPWSERVLSAVINTPNGNIEVHTVHVPPGSSNGWKKIETLESIYKRLAYPTQIPRILCGDFNTPQEEMPDGTVMTWGQKRATDGTFRLGRGGGKKGEPLERWDTGERNVLTGLAPFDLADVYRRLHGYSVSDFSFILVNRGRGIKRRFDHVFASSDLNPVACTYLHLLREEKLSDHSPIEVDFAPKAVATPELR